MLGSQAQHLKTALPPGLADAFGIKNLLSGPADRVETAEPVYRESSYRQPVAPPREPAAVNFLKWAWVPLVLLAAIWFFVQRSNRAKVGGTSEQVYREAPTVSYSNPRLTPGSAADNLSKAISSGDWSRTIHLDGLNFDNPGAMSDSVRGDLNDIGAVLANSPEVKVEITGYGETEEAALNQANSIKSSLASTGVSLDRLSTRGQVGSGVPSLKLSK
jgi:hypothetical protein